MSFMNKDMGTSSLSPVYVIIYLRVSGSKQSKYGESLEYQEEQCRAFCKLHGFVVLAVFKEQFTGTKDKRPTLDEALDFVKNSELKISFSVVYKIDRVSRG
jgi:DNA invertase Pin-like site-specific DNA recombinase